MSDGILTIKEVSGYFKITEKKPYQLAVEGKLHGFKVGSSWRSRRADLEKWVEKQKDSEGRKWNT